MTVQYRQGDLLLVKTNKIPGKAKPKRSNIIIEGEATGHAHRLVNGLIYENQQRYGHEEDNGMWIKAEKHARLVHEEHGPIDIEIGIYIVIRQREYNGETNRMVYD